MVWPTLGSRTAKEQDMNNTVEKWLFGFLKVTWLHLTLSVLPVLMFACVLIWADVRTSRRQYYRQPATKMTLMGKMMIILTTTMAEARLLLRMLKTRRTKSRQMKMAKSTRISRSRRSLRPISPRISMSHPGRRPAFWLVVKRTLIVLREASVLQWQKLNPSLQRPSWYEFHVFAVSFLMLRNSHSFTWHFQRIVVYIG